MLQYVPSLSNILLLVRIILGLTEDLNLAKLWSEEVIEALDYFINQIFKA